MSTPSSASILAGLAGALAMTLACTDAAQPGAAKREPSAAKAATTAAPSPATASGPKSAPPQGPSPVEVGEQAVSSDEAAPSEAPPWFRPEAFAHKKIVKRGASETPEGKTSELLLLELEPGTTAEQCIAAAEAKLGESIADLPARETTPHGYLTVLGEVEGYAFNVVCGMAKGTPTLYLSYTR